MNKFYSFTLYDGSRISFNIPIHNNGEIIAQRFMPDFLSPAPDSVSGLDGVSLKMQTVDSIEFETDCRTMLGYIDSERLPTNLDIEK